jgi:hypothetical protein
LPLAFASAVILRSDSCGTRDHILLSQIRGSRNVEGQVPVIQRNCWRRHFLQIYCRLCNCCGGHVIWLPWKCVYRAIA